MNIAVLEDNPVIGELMTIALTRADYKVSLYTRGIPFLEALRTHDHHISYDLVIVDLGLPGRLSGLEVIACIRDFFSSVLPIIVVSAAHQSELDRLHVSYPTLPILRKPFKIQMLLQAIEMSNIV